LRGFPTKYGVSSTVCCSRDPPLPKPLMSNIHKSPLVTCEGLSLKFGFVLALVGTVLFATKSIIVKLCYRAGLSPEMITATRYLIALPFYISIAFFARKPASFSLKGSFHYISYAVLLGIVGYWLSGYLDFLGLQYIDAQVERMILFTYPLMVVALGALLFGQKPSLKMVLAALISYSGLLVLFIQKNGEPTFSATGVGLVFASALMFSLYQLYAKPVIMKLGVPLATAVMMSGASLASLGALTIRQNQYDYALSETAIGLILLLSIGGTLLPSLLMNMALSKISSQANASIGSLGPVITLVLASLILKEKMGIVDICGMAFVIGGVAWFSLLEARRMKKPTNPN